MKGWRWRARSRRGSWLPGPWVAQAARGLGQSWLPLFLQVRFWRPGLVFFSHLNFLASIPRGGWLEREPASPFFVSPVLKPGTCIFSHFPWPENNSLPSCCPKHFDFFFPFRCPKTEVGQHLQCGKTWNLNFNNQSQVCCRQVACFLGRKTCLEGDRACLEVGSSLFKKLTCISFGHEGREQNKPSYLLFIFYCYFYLLFSFVGKKIFPIITG